MSLKLLKSGTTFLLFLTLTLGVMPFTTNVASAAPIAGATCTKANAKAKIGRDSYVCTQNPTVKRKRLTWVWSGCLDVAKYYSETKARFEQVKISASKAIAELDSEIIKLQTEAPSDEVEAKAFDQKALDAKAKQANAIQEATAATEKAKAAGLTTDAGKSLTNAATQWNKAANSYALAARNFEKSATSLRAKIQEVSKRERDKERVSQTLVNLESEVQSALSIRKNACQPGL